MGPLLALAAAGTALEIGSKLGAASSARKAADLRATALKKAAERRLAQGKQISEQKITEGGMAQTSFMASALSRGGDRQSLIQDLSLDEIAKRAKYESDMALSDAQLESEAMLGEAQAVSAQGRSAQKEALISSIGSILGLGASYYGGRYGKDAASASKLWEF